ncbi:hypothetical protein DICVIV_13702 [Dictyocaulus viviparus]|uniref:Uncharacterized protein n=1 Tax=Dictyocaulus viviparus TaxID=29172 RepID=A0A0D8XD53_DICVI|nr:hypothetical protein DICVIV_13702 [Dictyocaulus viviparus]
MVDNAQCCNCRKRWQLAILANIGFMIVFGIRCNFGAAKNHMFKNYTDPWGRRHMVDNAQCCNCRKRWQLAILANIGFMIVFGIRCNFGAAKNHMFKNYTDPWGRRHDREEGKQELNSSIQMFLA